MVNFKTKSKNIVSKILFAFLILSFVLFGISSFLLEGTGNWVAKINGKKISYQQLEKASYAEKETLLRQQPNNQNLTNYVNSAQFKFDVLSKIINEKLLEAISKDYGTHPDRTQILTNITKNTNFHKNGKFDHKLFKNILRSNGIDQENYIKIIANETVKLMTLNSINLVSPIDQDTSKKIANFKEELRYADLATISKRNIGKIKKPSDEELLTIYEVNKNEFQEPEKRNVKYISFNKSSLSGNVRITNKLVKEFYNTNREKFKTQQERSFYHIVFDGEEEANEFHRKLISSENLTAAFIELGKLSGKSKQQLLIKNITLEDSIPTVANKVFTTSLNKSSQVFKSEIGYHIVLVSKIYDGKVLPFYKVKKEIKAQLAQKLKKEAQDTKIKAIDELLISQNSLTQIVKKFRIGKIKKLKSYTFLPAQKELRVTKAARALDQFTQNAFKINSNQVTNLFEDKDKLYALVVNDIIAARTTPYEEAKSQLRKIYYQEQREKKLNSLAQEISEEISQNPKSIRAIAKKYSLRLQKYKKFNAQKKVKFQNQEFSVATDFLENLFAIKVNQATGYFKNENDGYQIAVLKKIKPPKLSLVTVNKHRSALSESYRNEFVEEFNKYIEKNYDLQVNSKFIESIKKQQNEL